MRPVFAATILVALTVSALALDNNHAVIIQGFLPAEGLPDVSNANELWNDCFLWYELMYNRPSIGGDSDRIHMLWGKGQDFRKDGDDRYDPARLGLYSITDDSASASTVDSCFSALAADSLESDDTMFVYTWGHGGKDAYMPRNAKHFSIMVRPVHYSPGNGYVGTHLWDTTFARMCDQVRECERVFVMQQCRAGGFIDDLNDDKTTMVCATIATEKAYSCDNDSRNGSPLPEHETTDVQGAPVVWRHAEFNFHVMNALRGTAIWPYNNPPAVDADTNNDGNVSWFEAFRYNQMHNSSPKTREVPVYCDPTAYSWRLDSVPRGLHYRAVFRGGALASTLPDSCDTVATSLWALKGNSTLELWKYDIGDDTWTARRDLPDWRHRPKDGATLTAGSGGRLYASLGAHRHYFMMYDTLSDSWQNLPDVPGRKLGRGTSATFAFVDSVPYVYLLNGNSSFQFSRFNLNTCTWETLPWAPRGPRNIRYRQGSCITFDGESTIYALKGYTNEFYAYSTASGTWSTESSLPFYDSSGVRVKASDGAGLAACGDWVFAMKGGKSRQMCAYNSLSNTWMQAQDVPLARSGKGVRYGGALVQAGGLIWILKGNKTDDFYRFAPNRCYDAIPGSPSPPEPGVNEQLLALDGLAEGARWSNSGGLVAYVAPDSAGRFQVFRVGVGGGSPVQLTNLPGECARPVWSNDDSLIAFEATLDSCEFSQIATVPATGGSVTYRTSSPMDHWHVTWSPTGTGEMAYLGEDSSGYAQVYALRMMREVALTCIPTDHETPEYVSSREIVYVREGANGHSQLFTVTVDSLHETALTYTAADHANPAPASDAGLVFYEYTDSSGHSQIASVRLVGGPESILTSGSSEFESPAANSDASAVYCTVSNGAGTALCSVDPSGGWDVLTDDLVERATPHVPPSGSSTTAAAYVRDGDVYATAVFGRSIQSAGLGQISLSRAVPSPSRGEVTIRWQVLVEAEVSLRVYSATGQLVKVLAEGRAKPGAYTSVWNGTDAKDRRLASGVYFYALDNGTKRISRKVILTE